MHKIIHHIAPGDHAHWHPVWHRCRDSFQQHFPNHNLMLWPDNQRLDQFVVNNYPEFRTVYENFPYHIMRLDFARLCILHHHGGIYADMDYVCYGNFSDRCENSFGIIANTDDTYTSASHENCLMWAQPNDAFLLELMRYTKACFIQYRNLLRGDGVDWRTESRDFAVNNSTGSGMISAAIAQIGQHFDIGFLPADLFNPPPASWHTQYLGKHLHSSIWGTEYLDHASRHGVIVRDGQLYNVGTNSEYQDVIAWQDLDFYKDYTS